MILEKRFAWTDQTTVDYANWGPSQPSIYGNEDCVELRTYNQAKGQWNDINCDKNNAFVCKKGECFLF